MLLSTEFAPMNRRVDNRIEMKLRCELMFPEVWRSPVVGVTANLHRNGVLVACDLSSLSRQLPSVGERACVRIGLPPNPAFGTKCIDCETTLIRIRQTGESQWHVALRIQAVNFTDWAGGPPRFGDPESDSCRFVV